MRKLRLYMLIDNKEFDLLYITELGQGKFKIDLHDENLKITGFGKAAPGFFRKDLTIQEIYHEVLPNKFTLNNIRKELEESLGMTQFTEFDILYKLGTCSNDMKLEVAPIA